MANIKIIDSTLTGGKTGIQTEGETQLNIQNSQVNGGQLGLDISYQTNMVSAGSDITGGEIAIRVRELLSLDRVPEDVKIQMKDHLKNDQSAERFFEKFESYFSSANSILEFINNTYGAWNVILKLFL